MAEQLLPSREIPLIISYQGFPACKNLAAGRPRVFQKGRPGDDPWQRHPQLHGVFSTESQELSVKRQLLVVAGILGLGLAVAAPASAWCPIPTEQPVYCSGTNGCTGSTFRYTCSGLGTTNYTCGGACSADIKCCGNAVGKQRMGCEELCAGCQGDGKAAREVACRYSGALTVAKAEKPKEDGPRKAAPAAVQARATAPAASGRPAGDGR